MTTQSKDRFLVTAVLVVVIVTVGYYVLNAPDRRTPGEKIGDAVDELGDRTPGERISDVIKDDQ